MTTIGVDVGGTTIKLGVVGSGAQIMSRDTRSTPRDPKIMAETIADMIRTAERGNPGSRAAISIAGAFNRQGGFDANQLGFQNIPLRALLREALGHDIAIENDGVCALLAEHDMGALTGCDCCLMITLGTGIGGGVIAGGVPYRGCGGVHAELGHMITHAGGKRCSCGQIGCWEAYASATALSEMAGGLPPREVIDRVRAGEFHDIWQRYLYEVTQGLVSLCSIFCPERIAIGGGISNVGSLLMDGIQEQLAVNPGYQAYFTHIPIVPACFLNDAGILGAAALARQETP